MKPLKLGTVGTNFVSDWLVDAAKTVEGIEVTTVYSRTAEKGNEFAARHGISRVMTDWEAFLSSDLDAVYIATPNSLHFPQAKDAILHGKHVLVEKPATLTEDEFVALSALAREKGVILMEAMRPAHDPAILAIREALPALGPIRRAVFEFCQYSSRYDKFKEGVVLNAFNPHFGNAAVMDIGVYALHACIMTFGEPESVQSSSLVFPNGMEGMGKATLSYGDFTCDVVYSKIHDSCSPSFVSGSDGAVVIGKISTGENVTLRLRGKEDRPLVPSRPATPEQNMTYELADFVSAVRGELAVAPFTENTRLTLRVIDEIRRQNNIRFE